MPNDLKSRAHIILGEADVFYNDVDVSGFYGAPVVVNTFVGKLRDRDHAEEVLRKLTERLAKHKSIKVIQSYVGNYYANPPNDNHARLRFDFEILDEVSNDHDPT